jgi:hypothetical protein
VRLWTKRRVSGGKKRSLSVSPTVCLCLHSFVCFYIGHQHALRAGMAWGERFKATAIQSSVIFKSHQRKKHLSPRRIFCPCCCCCCCCVTRAAVFYSNSESEFTISAPSSFICYPRLARTRRESQQHLFAPFFWRFRNLALPH